MLLALLIIAAVLVLPVAVGLFIRGDPDNAIRHESTEPDGDGVKRR